MEDRTLLGKPRPFFVGIWPLTLAKKGTIPLHMPEGQLLRRHVRLYMCDDIYYILTGCIGDLYFVRFDSGYSDLLSALDCPRTEPRGQYKAENRAKAQSKRGKHCAHYSQAICNLRRNCCFSQKEFLSEGAVVLPSGASTKAAVIYI